MLKPRYERGQPDRDQGHNQHVALNAARDKHSRPGQYEDQCGGGPGQRGATDLDQSTASGDAHGASMADGITGA